MRILSYDDLKSRGISYSKVHLWRLEKARKFPPRVPLTDNRYGWVDAEIDQWLAERIHGFRGRCIEGCSDAAHHGHSRQCC